jgi:hypothetical protein
MFQSEYSRLLRKLVTVLLLSSVLMVIPSAMSQQLTTSTSFVTSESIWTTTFSSESSESYSTSFALSGPIGNLNQPGSGPQVTCYFMGLPFDAQAGQVVTGTVHPGPIGVVLGIMNAATYSGFSTTSSSESCLELISPYSASMTSYVDSNNTLHFTWKAPSTASYDFVILNAAYAGSVAVQFTASAIGSVIVTFTGYQAQTSQLLQTLLLASTTASSLQAQPSQSITTSNQSFEFIVPLVIVGLIAAALVIFKGTQRAKRRE